MALLGSLVGGESDLGYLGLTKDNLGYWNFLCWGVLFLPGEGGP